MLKIRYSCVRMVKTPGANRLSGRQTNLRADRGREIVRGREKENQGAHGADHPAEDANATGKVAEKPAENKPIRNNTRRKGETRLKHCNLSTIPKRAHKTKPLRAGKK